MKIEFYDPDMPMRFMKYPKFLDEQEPFYSMTRSAKFLYMLMLDRARISKTKNWADRRGHLRVYFAKEKVAELLDCSEREAESLLQELEGVGIIVRDSMYPDTVYPKIVTSL